MSYMDLYHRQIQLPEFQKYMVLSNNRILTWKQNILSLFSSAGQLLLKYQAPSKIIEIYNLDVNNIIINIKIQVIRLNLQSKQSSIIKQIDEQDRTKFKIIGNWKGGLLYIINKKLYSNEHILQPLGLKQDIIEISNNGNIVRYHQLDQLPNILITNYTISDKINEQSEQNNQIIIITNYTPNLNFNDRMLIKVLEMDKQLIILSNKNNQGIITNYDKESGEIKYQFNISDNIIDVLRFQQESGIVILLTNLRNKPMNYKVLHNNSIKQSIKIINLRSKQLINAFYLPKIISYKCHHQSNIIAYTTQTQPLNSKLNILKTISKNKIYIHLMNSIKINEIFSDVMVKQAIKNLN